jgi:hypothetical protein
MFRGNRNSLTSELAIAVDKDVPAMIGKIIGTLIQHRATVENISSSLSAALLGVPFPVGNSIGHDGTWSERYFKTMATASELPMESATETSACWLLSAVEVWRGDSRVFGNLKRN